MSYMYAQEHSRDGRRSAPRIGTEALCNEVVAGRDRFGIVVDVSETGLRFERPFTGGRTERIVQLEIELPGMDEIIWAKGEVCFDHVRPGASGLLRTSGVRLAAACARDLRLLRDYVMGVYRADCATSPLATVDFASRWALG